MGPPGSWLRLWGSVPYRQSSPGYCITFMKRLDEGLRWQLMGQKPLISPGLYISIRLAKFEFRGRVTWLSILFLITVVRVCCCTRRC